MPLKVQYWVQLFSFLYSELKLASVNPGCAIQYNRIYSAAICMARSNEDCKIPTHFDIPPYDRSPALVELKQLAFLMQQYLNCICYAHGMQANSISISSE